MEFGYRLLRGREGVSGHIRGMGRDCRIAVRGLTPGWDCALYALREGRATLCCRQRVDGEGQVMLSTAQPGRLFLTAGERVVAWEEGPASGETYFQACQWLQKEAEQKRQKERADQKNEAARAEPEAIHEKKTDEASAEEQRAEDAPESPPPSSREPWQAYEPAARASPVEEAPAPYTLRAPGVGEPVDALPALRWAAAVREMQRFFRGRMPFAPFPAPGWRFVRAPSSIPGVPYCAVGYWAMDGIVRKTAWAVPGMPQRPPVPLPGYHYRPGANGMGYWVIERETEDGAGQRGEA